MLFRVLILDVDSVSFSMKKESGLWIIIYSWSISCDGQEQHSNHNIKNQFTFHVKKKLLAINFKSDITQRLKKRFYKKKNSQKEKKKIIFTGNILY